MSDTCLWLSHVIRRQRSQHGIRVSARCRRTLTITPYAHLLQKAQFSSTMCSYKFPAGSCANKSRFGIVSGSQLESLECKHAPSDDLIRVVGNAAGWALEIRRGIAGHVACLGQDNVVVLPISHWLFTASLLDHSENIVVSHICSKLHTAESRPRLPCATLDVNDEMKHSRSPSSANTLRGAAKSLLLEDSQPG